MARTLSHINTVAEARGNVKGYFLFSIFFNSSSEAGSSGRVSLTLSNPTAVHLIGRSSILRLRRLRRILVNASLEGDSRGVYLGIDLRRAEILE